MKFWTYRILEPPCLLNMESLEVINLPVGRITHFTSRLRSIPWLAMYPTLVYFVSAVRWYKSSSITTCRYLKTGEILSDVPVCNVCVRHFPNHFLSKLIDSLSNKAIFNFSQLWKSWWGILLDNYHGGAIEILYPPYTFSEKWKTILPDESNAKIRARGSNI